MMQTCGDGYMGPKCGLCAGGYYLTPEQSWCSHNQLAACCVQRAMCSAQHATHAMRSGACNVQHTPGGLGGSMRLTDPERTHFVQVLDVQRVTGSMRKTDHRCRTRPSAPCAAPAAAASAPGLGSPLATFAPGSPFHICTGTGLTPCHICAGTGLTLNHICAGTGIPRPVRLPVSGCACNLVQHKIQHAAVQHNMLQHMRPRLRVSDDAAACSALCPEDSTSKLMRTVRPQPCTGLAAATSAPGLGPPLPTSSPGLGSPCHICTGTGLA
jgi:hypothetical protein